MYSVRESGYEPSAIVSRVGSTQPLPSSTWISLIWSAAPSAYAKPANPRALAEPSIAWMITLSSGEDW